MCDGKPESAEIRTRRRENPVGSGAFFDIISLKNYLKKDKNRYSLNCYEEQLVIVLACDVTYVARDK